MIKKITMLIFLILFSVTVSLGQMATLEQKTAYPNTTTSVAVNVDGFVNINSVTFYIQYDPDVLDYIGLSDQALPGMIADVSGSVINITWSSPVMAYSPAGVLCKINFLYKGSFSDLEFLPGCEVTQGPNPFLVGYANGSVGPVACNSGDALASIGNVSVAAGSVVSVPVNFQNFQDIGAFTQYISYDDSRFSFVSVTTTGNLNGTVYNSDNGVITLSWVTPGAFPAGRNINTIPASANTMMLNFQCNLPASSPVEFGPGGVFTSGAPFYSNVLVCYSSGGFTQSATTETAVLGSLTGVIQGDEIMIPLDLNISVPVSAFTLYLEFNAPVLGYTGIEVVDPLSADVMADATGNILTLLYTNVTPAIISSGTFLKVKFHYNGVGAGLVNFVGISQFADGLMQPINVSFTNSTVAPGVYPPNATVSIGSVAATVNAFVDVPLEIDGASSNPLGAATMFIGYDPGKLSFIGAVDNIYGANVDYSNNQISIAWADAYGVNLSGTFLKLRFQYNGGGGTGCGSVLYFMNDIMTLQSCELANSVAAFVPANWVDGGVNLNPGTPAINGPANPAFNSAVNYTTDAGMINYSWVIAGGSIASGNGTSSVVVNWGAAGPGSVAVSYHTSGGCFLTGIKPVTILSGNPTTDIQGYVTYDNFVLQGMNGVNISLFNSLGVQVGATIATTTNATDGYYSFPGVPQDTYTMNVSLAAQWAGIAGVTATDALLVELHTAGLLNPPLSGIRYLAANVNGGSSLNATDALFIKKRIIGDISSFPAGDWVFDNGMVNAFINPVTTYNFKGLCTGDVNGSYNPLVFVKSASYFNVTDNGIQKIGLNNSFTYEMTSGMNLPLGALTLYLGYDQDMFTVEEVSSSLPGLESSISNGTVILAWSNSTASQIRIDQEIVRFRITAKQAINTPSGIFTVKTGSEFAGPLADVQDDVRIKMAKVQMNSTSLSLSCYPNPFRTSANFVFSTPELGHARLVLTNLVGKQICVLADEMFDAGQHTIVIDADRYNLSPGIYFGKLEFEAAGEKISAVNKIVLTK